MKQYNAHEKAVLKVLARQHGASPLLEISALGYLTPDQTVFAVSSLKNKGKVKVKSCGPNGIRDEIVILQRNPPLTKKQVKDIILVGIVLLATTYLVWKGLR